MESKEQVKRIKEILPNCTEREICDALKDCKMDPDDAVQRLLSQVETEKNREAVPMEEKEKVELIKKIVPRFAAELIYEMLKQCNMDSNLAIQRLLSQEMGKNKERSPAEWKEQFDCIKEMVPRFTEADGEGVPMEWKEQVERIKEMMPCFTEEMIYKMLEQCYIDSDLTLPRLLSPEIPSNGGSLLNNFSSSPSSAKSSVTSQLHSVSLDKGKEVVWHTKDDAATTSRSDARALRAKGPWNSHAVKAGSDPMALGNNVASSSGNDSGNNVALGSSEFLEHKLFSPPTQQNGPSEATLSNSAMSCIQPFMDPQDPVVDAPFASSRHGPIQRPGRMSEDYNNAARNHLPDSGAMSVLPELQHGDFPGWAPLPAKASDQRGEVSSLQYPYRGYPSWCFSETSITPNHQQPSPYDMTTSDLQDPSIVQPPGALLLPLITASYLHLQGRLPSLSST